MARTSGVNFHGRRIIHPGAHGRIDASALSTVGSPEAKKIIFVGSSEGGEPGKIHWFNNPADARDVLRGGNLYKAGELAWAPSTDGVGAGLVGFLRVENAEQSKLEKGKVTFKSKDWGAHTNRIQAKLEDGTTPGSKRLTLYYWPDSVREIYDNIGPIFDIKYVGSEAYASLTIEQDPTTKKASKLIVKVGADEGSAVEALSYDLGDGEYADINKLVFDINEHVDFEANMNTTGNKNLRTDELDPVDNVEIMDKVDVLALTGDLVHQTQFSQLVSVEINDSGDFPENFDFEYFTGGSDGQVPASWHDQFQKLAGEDVYFVVPLTADAAIHAECLRFVNSQSNNERSPMVCLVGGDVGETNIDSIIGRALTLADSRAILVAPGGERRFFDGTIEKIPAYMVAAMVAGRLAGKETGDPITLDYLDLVSVEKVFASHEVDRLIQGGVTVVEFVRQSNRVGYRIAQGVTTYQVDSNPSYREISMRMVTDEISTELVELLENQFVGGKGTVTTVALIKNEVQSFLSRKVNEEVLVSYDPESVTVRLEGDVVYIDYQVVPVGAINYILVTAKFNQQAIIS